MSNRGSSPIEDFLEAYRQAYSSSNAHELFADDQHQKTKSEQTSDASAAFRMARADVEQYILTNTHKTRWTDVIGNDEAKAALIAAVETPIKHSDLFARYNKTPARGILLSGPPGCGKTMLAKAVAGELSRLHGKTQEMLLLNGPEIQSPYIGKTEKTIRELFTYAREYQQHRGHPLVIFIDEADSLFPVRGTGYRYEDSQVAAFLSEMDGLKQASAFVILATNRPETIDAAVKRPGRIDRLIQIKRPDREHANILLHKLLSVALMPGEDKNAIVANCLDDLFRDSPIASGSAISGKYIKRWHVTLADTISSAAIVGLVERAKEFALSRDIPTGVFSGLTLPDFKNAIKDMRKEAAQVDSTTVLEVLHKFPSETLDTSPMDFSPTSARVLQ